MSQPVLRPVGVIRSALKTRRAAPKQGSEGAPDAWIEIHAITWLHRAKRGVLRVHPRSDVRNPLTGVFATRSPDRPNPLGLHPVTVRAIDGNRLRVGPIEAIDGTPVVDLKPVLIRARGGNRSNRSRWRLSEPPPGSV